MTIFAAGLEKAAQQAGQASRDRGIAELIGKPGFPGAIGFGRRDDGAWLSQARRRAPPLRIDDGDSFDLDHEIGAGEAGYAYGRAGWSGHAKIAHADIATLLKFVEISDEGIGLYDVGPSRTGRLEALVEVFERLFHLGAHVALADAIAVDITGQLTGGVYNLAGTAHCHNV
jgi:hypothetical protein